MPASPESIVGAELTGIFAPPAGARAHPTPVAYKLVRFVGAGKFAWVYEGQALAGDAQTPRVAVKVLYREDTQGIRRFQREVKVMRQLPAHPNCVAYKGHGTWERMAWVAMDFVDGFTLAAVLRSKRPLPPRTACLLMTQLCDGFEGLHRLGLTHRDITPDNIMLTQADRQVKLMDFGLVQDSQGLLQLYEQVDILDGEDFKDDLDAGLIAGTPEFMAPEQILDPHERDRARQKTDTTADVFALGTICYQLLSGTQLFPYEVGARGATGKQALVNYLEYRVRLRDEDLARPDGLDAELWSIVRKSLAHEPKLRQRDATELGADLRHYLETGQGVVEDDMSATIAAPFDLTQLKSLAVRMSAGDFAPIEAAAVAAGVELTQPSARRPKLADVEAAGRMTDRLSGPADRLSGPADRHSAPSGDRFAAATAGPDAPLSPKRTLGERALAYGGPASERPTRVEGDAPAANTYPAPQQRRERTWMPWAIGGAVLALGVLAALLLR